MPFAARSDLLARSHARRLAQLAIPADLDMPPLESLRVALAGGDLSAYSTDDQQALTLALSAIDQALADADELMLSHGVPATAQTPLLARLASTIALYFLTGPENMTEEVRRAYEGAVATLKAHARGDMALVPPAPGETAPGDDLVVITSASPRYGAPDADGDF